MCVQHLLIGLIFISWLKGGVVHAQKHDHVWISGYQFVDDPQDSTFGFTVLDFNEKPRTVRYNEDIEINIGSSNAMMCDEEGRLLFYTNGVYIANYNHDTLNPGIGLNKLDFRDGEREIGQILNQGLIILPLPEHKNIFYIFHMNRAFLSSIGGVHVDVLYYSIVDMSLNNGTGGLIKENQVIQRDTFRTGNIQAVKHANGRDWWVVLPERNTDRMFQMLLTPQGIIHQDYVPLPDTLFDGLGQSVFTPDGSRYVSYDNYYTGGLNHSHLDVLSFDRCTGKFSDFQRVLQLNTQPCYGLAASPNSRFAYLFNATHVYQVDLSEPIDEDNYLVVAEYDGYRSPFSTVFNTGQLAPDGKIYMSSCNGVNTYHVIEYPNLKGEDCFVNQHSLQLYTSNLSSVPNFPNYRLGALKGSPCDSLITSSNDVTTSEAIARIYPNPTTDDLYLQVPQSWRELALKIRIYDADGRVVWWDDDFIGRKVSVTQLPQGMYSLFVELKEDSRSSVALPFVITR